MSKGVYMVFLVFNQWDETGGSPTAIERFKNREELSKRLTEIDNQKIRNGIKYEILLVVEGIEYIPRPVRTWDYIQSDVRKLTDDMNKGNAK
jgi:hypothetical protein